MRIADSGSDTEPESDDEPYNPGPALRRVTVRPDGVSFEYVGGGGRSQQRQEGESQDSFGSLPSAVLDFAEMEAEDRNYSYDSQLIF